MTILDGIITGLREIGGMVGNVFEFMGKGKLDATEATKQYYALELKIRELVSYAYQLELSLTEKMMVGATWTRPLALITGITIIVICVFNTVCRTMGWGVNVDLMSGELLLLIGMFVFVSSGSVKLLLTVAEKLSERWNEKQKTEAK